MGPATPNPLKSGKRSTAASWQGGGPVRHSVGEVAKGVAIPFYKTLSHACNLRRIPHMLFYGTAGASSPYT